MLEWRNSLLPQKKQARVDQWALITQQKTLQDQKAKQYQSLLSEQKRKRLKQHLDAQIYQKQRKQQLIKLQEQKYAEEALRKVRQIEQAEKQRKRVISERKKQVQSENKYLFSGIIEQKIKQSTSPNHYSMDIGYRAQLQRKREVEQQKRRMVDELDRQIQEKERVKVSQREQELQKEKQDLSYQSQKQQNRQLQNTWRYRQNNLIQEKYQQLVEKQNRKEKMFEMNHVEVQAQRKREEELRRASQKDHEKKYANLRMKEILDQQVKIHEQRRREDERVNPQQLSYGLIGRMLTNRNHSPYNHKQQYYQQLSQQVQDKHVRKQAEKYMNQEEYRINLNQLNRAVQGKFASQSYIDRSIHALSEPHAVNVTLIDAKVERPSVEAIKPKLQELKNRNKERHVGSPFDLNKSF